ncbi:unnamed protein product [Bursaphelenchus xylophilus]|uniref:(pine wood nematode) hypothetical protein n=1 Tax=Bursaphelenchus xylophilus TaxID=6326 RepID=A0A1I7RH81_BURXY|nr:unnamed protein product [Bursaphelenchus xylophilus]CAG9115942.1 unnamed protein product [Bursaphelenchus xylophilus]
MDLPDSDKNEVIRATTLAPFVFISGNDAKIRDALRVLAPHIPISILSFDLLEIQGEPSEVAIHKCNEALKMTKGNVIIEDTALCLEALGGMPGPYIKWFIHSLDLDGLYKMLVGFNSFKATVISTVAVGLYNSDGKTEVLLFEARVDGQIVSPRGNLGDRNGWDPCFEPNNQSMTYSEMDPEARKLHCARQMALRKALLHLQTRK